MAVRDDFSAGEVLAAADLNDTFAAKLPYSYGTATPTTSEDGFLWYDENDTPPTPKFWDGAAFQALTSGKILQVVETNDDTGVTNSTTTYTDLLTLSITPSNTSSKVLVFASALLVATANTNAYSKTQITRGGTTINEANLVGNGTAASNILLHTLTQLDSPGVNTSVQYKLQMAKGSGLTASAETRAGHNYSLTLLEVAL